MVFKKRADSRYQLALLRIETALINVGCQVYRLNQPHMPRWLVVRAGITYLLDYHPAKGFPMNKQKRAFWDTFSGPGGVVVNEDEALQVVGLV